MKTNLLQTVKRWLAGALALGSVSLLGADEAPAPLKPRPYPLETCLVSGEKLGRMGEPHVVVHADREFRLCCKGCEKDFRKDPATFVTKFDAAWKKVKPYPLKTCLVSGEELGSMGKPVGFVYQGQEVRLCCKGCRKDFDKDPKAFLKKLPTRPKAP
ncbi:MAG: TRASH domain-containing protein [Verrucomicrobiales bacterium]|nr:TRASH domain-containing protein [Verrucomicrobiales bacterium]